MKWICFAILWSEATVLVKPKRWPNEKLISKKRLNSSWWEHNCFIQCHRLSVYYKVCVCECGRVVPVWKRHFFFVLAAVVLIVILTFPCLCWRVSSKVIAQWHFIVKSNACKTYAHSLLYRKWKVLLIFTDFFLPRGKMNQFCFWRFLPSNQTLPPCWCIIGESVLFLFLF